MSAAEKSLRARILRREARVGVMGLGYVGLPLALEFARKGFSVLGFDVDAARVRALKAGRSYVRDVSPDRLGTALRLKRFEPLARFDALSSCDALVICVPTPLRKSREPDVGYIAQAAREAARRLKAGRLVVLESTSYPGTTRELVLPLFEERGLRAGRDFFLAFSPERVDPANPQYRIENTPKVVGGLTPACSALARLLYSQIVEKVVPVSGPEAAEMVKLLENTFRAVNIGLVNEMALMCHKLGLDVWEIVAAAATKPFGFMPFYPGPGLGGHCIPVDPQYLAWKMKSLNFEPRFIELAGVINAAMPEHVVGRIGEILNEAGRPLKGSRVLLVGVAYKPEVTDVRESPSLDVLHLLLERGARLSYHDPFVPVLDAAGLKLRSTALTDAALRAADMTVIATAHKDVPYGRILRSSRLIFDTRNALRGASRKGLYRL